MVEQGPAGDGLFWNLHQFVVLHGIPVHDGQAGADRYWLSDAPDPEEYDKAEAILQRGLARPNLSDRSNVLDRLADLPGASAPRL